MASLTTDDLTGVNHEGAHPNLILKYLTASSIKKIKGHINRSERKWFGVF